MDDSFSKLKAEADRIVLPDECEENDRAVRYLALETGVGHYDNLNLLIMSVLFIFISVAFLAVNGGKINESDEEFSLNKETFLSGEFTKGLEERYIRDLPIPDTIRAAEERVSLLYGFGNTVTERKKSGNYGFDNNSSRPDDDANAFERDDNSMNENAVVTKAVQTDKDGNTVTEAQEAETAPGGGTTAVARPASTMSTYTMPEEEEETTTTNNDPPSLTTTTTTIVTTSRTETETVSSSETESETSTPSETELPETSPSETEPSETSPSETEPPETQEPAE